MRTLVIVTSALCLAGLGQASPQEQLIRVDLAYRAPGNGPAPNFSPYGTQVPLVPAAAGRTSSDPGAIVKTGTIKVGPDAKAWVPIAVTSDKEHPQDLCRLFVDRNRNGDFRDDEPSVAVPSQNEKTKAWWTSFNKIELSVPYGNGVTESYLINAWIVREDTAAAPDVLRYSVGSWRAGSTTVNGVRALVAAMDANNDAVFDKNDKWSVLQASAPDAEKAVLQSTEARPANRFMFVQDRGKESVLEFRSFSPDGRVLTLAVVNRPVTKAEDRAPDDMLAAERPRPRTTTPFTWGHRLDEALANAKASSRKVFVDFETTWCGPCHSMDEWIWTDAEVASTLNAGYVGVKLDGDIEKALVKRFTVTGYPTMLILDASGKELNRLVGYRSSAEMMARLK
jgi:thiol-disulfide isomerase/thioredoxin